MDNSILSVQNVTKRIGKKSIIEDISFEVKRGEIFGLIGPNGSGKTTLIRMIVGLISKTTGTITINDIDIYKEPTKILDEVGVIIESPEMYKYMSGYKNLIHFARMSNKDIPAERINEIVRNIGLESSIHRKVRSYSLGMRQRLGIAQALLHEPSLLILDEPTNGLDPQGILELRDYLKRLRNNGKSIIISSHLLSEMQLICDRAGIIEKGKLINVISLKDEDYSQQKEFEVDNAPKAGRILMEKEFQVDIVNNNKFRVFSSKDEIPNIITMLHKKDIKIYYINNLDVQLEEEYFNLTKAEGQ